MKIIKNELTRPADLVAFDEILLRSAMDGMISEAIWLWEPSEIFAVLGRTSRSIEEVFLKECRKDHILVLRRRSGGASVLQGPGCVNYSLVLRCDKRTGLENVRSSYEEILGPIVRAFCRDGSLVTQLGLSDLALEGKKFSGNAQFRRGNIVLHHGSILADLDLDAVSRFLAHPPEEPPYRKNRPHSEFLTNVGVSPERVKRLLLEAYPPDEGVMNFGDESSTLLEELKKKRYCNDNWTYKF